MLMPGGKPFFVGEGRRVVTAGNDLCFITWNGIFCLIVLLLFTFIHASVSLKNRSQSQTEMANSGGKLIVGSNRLKPCPLGDHIAVYLLPAGGKYRGIKGRIYTVRKRGAIRTLIVLDSSSDWVGTP